MRRKPIKPKEKKTAGFYWLLTLFIAAAWLGCAVIFVDLCLSFGGGNNSGCVSSFDYPDVITGIAIAGVVLLIPAFCVTGLVALVTTFFGYRRKV
ncbi:hypothetical protein [Rheinheimera sp.]|uniref:hypothetical protein n=1 Tax=Rheinheimera sp. TaxID=1869214 RepID=UPI00273734C9|nr:hypothetical protein [Rheinheimera sp.]MDP2715210.1 hypothetical protein [Rheinheimera sp.]